MWQYGFKYVNMHVILQAGRAEGPSDHVRGLAGHLLHCMPHTCQTGMCVLTSVYTACLFCHFKKEWGVCVCVCVRANHSFCSFLKQVTLNLFFHICTLFFSQDELGCRVDFLLERCFQTEREEMETMENVNKLLLQNVLPLHVASFFMGKTIRNQVKKTKHGRDAK